MNALLYSNDIISPQIASIKAFVDTQFDHSWLIGNLDIRLFSEQDMQELRMELADIASYGARSSRLDFAIERLEKLRIALVRLDSADLRRRLRERRENTVRKELILSTLEANARRLGEAIMHIRQQR
jgi:hypothetical protein